MVRLLPRASRFGKIRGMENDDPKHELRARVVNDLGYHRPPTEDAAEAIRELRVFALAYSTALIDACPVGRDLSVALTHVEEASRAAIASIAKTWPLAD